MAHLFVIIEVKCILSSVITQAKSSFASLNLLHSIVVKGTKVFAVAVSVDLSCDIKH